MEWVNCTLFIQIESLNAAQICLCSPCPLHVCAIVYYLSVTGTGGFILLFPLV